MSTFKVLGEKAHCSTHAYQMNGCSDCTVHQDYKNATTKLEKAPVLIGTTPLVIKPRVLGPKAQLIRQQLSRVLAVFFSGAAKSAAKAAGKKAREFTKITKEEEKELALAAFLAIEWDSLVDSTAITLMAAYQTGAKEAMQQLNITSEEFESAVVTASVDYANNRAAEMIGKQYVDEKLVDNSAAKYVITETTKDDLHDVVEAASDANDSIAEMEERIKLAATFSDRRVQLISDNEISVASSAGGVAVWKRSSFVTKINVVLSDQHEVYDECDKHAAGSPYDVHEVPVIPAHPFCMCGYEVIEVVQ